jgi:hypothetical protein
MRLHDKIYLTEDPNKIKELFVSIANEIDKNEKDYMRSWTEKDLNKKKQIYNATHLRQPQHTAVIRKI